MTQSEYNTAMGLDALKTDPLGPLALELAKACDSELGPELNALRVLEILRHMDHSPAIARMRELGKSCEETATQCKIEGDKSRWDNCLRERDIFYSAAQWLENDGR